MDTWILVADSSRARLFAASQRGKPWNLVEELRHPESRERTAEIDPTERGMQRQSFGYGSPAMEAKTAPRLVEHHHFAEELARKLDAGLKHGDYGALVIAASPKFLGHLKGILDKQVVKCITAAIDKDYTNLDERELAEQLEEMVWGISVQR
ncbi:MAG TPA: host attachment protein [Pirellulales bacterium]|nr:host attachment protein [Pirellulales bacterium]